MDSLDTFRERFDALEQQTAQLMQHTHIVERQLRWWRGTALLLLVLGLVSWPLSGAMTQAQVEVGVQALTLEQRVAALEQKLRFLTTFLDPNGRPLMQIAGANLRIVNGTGATATVNGLGNLVVGYNEPRAGGPNTRTGSHNLVVGKERNFSNTGGLVVGLRNTIGNFASVSGGVTNAATSPASSISGGFENLASGHVSSISGGANNVATGSTSSVSGGLENHAAGSFASVSGGEGNVANGNASAVSGRQVRKYLRELIEHELLITRQYGLAQTNTYHFLWHKWMEDSLHQGLELKFHSRRNCSSRGAELQFRMMGLRKVALLPE